MRDAVLDGPKASTAAVYSLQNRLIFPSFPPDISVYTAALVRIREDV
jgi:hypothetical protein